MHVALGCDHKGFPAKDYVRNILTHQGHVVVECGTYSAVPVDFPDVAVELCSQVTGDAAERGILVCSTGVGAVMATNKVPGIRATLCSETYTAHQSVEHDDANVLCLGADIVGELVMEEIVTAFLRAEFDSAPEFQRRVAKLNALDQLSPVNAVVRLDVDG